MRERRIRLPRRRPARGSQGPVRRLSSSDRADPALLSRSRHSAPGRRHGRHRRGDARDRQDHRVSGQDLDGGRGMIEPYTAVGLIPSFWGIRRREDNEKNLEHIESLTKAAFWLSNLDIPVRLIAIPEGALQGFNDEVLDVDHTEFARTCAIDIPGPETDRLGQLARQWGVFIMAQAKARHEDWPDRFFNIGFVIDPDGAVVLKHYKISALLPCERSISPHDLFDWWVEKYGRTLQAFWPVADTAIGRLGIMMAMEGNYPENGRGLALNGAEVVYRASLPAPFAQNDFFEISNRARALENNMYMIAPNMSSYYV